MRSDYFQGASTCRISRSLRSAPFLLSSDLNAAFSPFGLGRGRHACVYVRIRSGRKFLRGSCEGFWVFDPGGDRRGADLPRARISRDFSVFWLFQREKENNSSSVYVCVRLLSLIFGRHFSGNSLKNGSLAARWFVANRYICQRF